MTEGERPPWWPLVEVRRGFAVGFRSSVLVAQLLLPEGAARGAWLLVAAATVLVDGWTYWVLGRDERSHFAVRTVLDALYVAVWSLAPYRTGRYSLATMAAIPLAVEAGIRVPRRAPALAAGLTAVAVVTRMGAHRPLDVLSVVWPAFGCVAGWVMRWTAVRSHMSAARAAALRRAAECRRMLLTGRNAVAMSADSVHDRLVPLRLLLRPSPGTALDTVLHDHKRLLRDETSEVAVYLADALLGWARQEALVRPIHDEPRPTWSQRAGLTILSHPQAQALRRALAELDLRGEFHVDLASRTNPAPGRSIELLVDNAVVRVPADDGPSTVPFDIGPLWFFFGACNALATTSSGGEGEPVVVAVAIAVVFAGAGLMARRWSQAGRSRRRQIVNLAVVLCIGYSVVATAALRTSAGGEHWHGFPAQTPLQVLAGLGALYAMADRRIRVRILVGAAVTAVLGVVLLPGWIGGRNLMNGLVLWPAATWFVTALLPGRVERAAIELDEREQAADAEAAVAAFAQGQAEVLDLLEEAMAQAHELADRATLPVDELPLLRRALEDADVAFERLVGANS